MNDLNLDSDLLNALDEGGANFFLFISDNGIIEHISNSLAKELHYSKLELQGHNISVILKGGLIQLQNELSNVRFKAELITKSSVHFSVSIFAKVLKENKYLLVIETFQYLQSKSSEYDSKLSDANTQIQEKTKTIEYLENHIIENEIRLRLALNAVNDGVWDWNVVDNSFYFSDRFFTMLGYDPFEFPHSIQSWNAILTNDGVEMVDFLNSLLENGKSEFSFEYKLQKKNRTSAWILCRGAIVERDVAGKALRLVGTHVDITHLKEIETSLKAGENKLKKQNDEFVKINKKLTESNKKSEFLNFQLQDKQAYLNSILKTVPASITLISDNIILYANNYTFLMTGYDLEELLGHNIGILFNVPGHPHQLNSNFFSSTTPGISKSITTVWLLKEGSCIDVYLTATCLDSEIAPNAFTISVVDISAQRLYEEELIKAKEQAEKAERLKMIFLSNISHELRTPMNGIIGFAEMLRETSNPIKREEYLKVIINSSKQLMRIITDLMEISKIETGEIETFFSTVDINFMFTELYESYKIQLQQRNKELIEISFLRPQIEMNSSVFIDEVKLRYILNCLLMNAMKFTETGIIKFGYEKIEDNLQIFVSDTGIGIEESDKEIIFESFRQSESSVRKKYGGNGLGLAIARGFVNILGGKIWVESIVGEGTVFYVSLPYKPMLISDVQIKGEMLRNYFWDKYHILVVEDDLTCFTLIEELLEETGIKISHAATGLEAVKVCRKEGGLNIVLMDMRLPEMDGYEATKRIKEFRPDLAVIAQTAHALSEDRKKCINAGCNDYITKPIEQEKLLPLIEKYLEISSLSL